MRKRDESDLKFMDKLKKDWYFETVFEKILLVASVVALIYSIVRIIIQGFW